MFSLFFSECVQKSACETDRFIKGLGLLKKLNTNHAMPCLRVQSYEEGSSQQPQANRSELLSFNNSITNWKKGDPAVPTSSFFFLSPGRMVVSVVVDFALVDT